MIERSQTDSELSEAEELVGIQIDNLVFGYRDAAPVLDQLSLSVSPGEIVALVGASGCGKSTLLRAIAKLIEPGCGAIDFTGKRPNRRAGDLAFVFQDANLLPWRTVEENVRLPFEVGGHDKQSSVGARHDAEELDTLLRDSLESVGLHGADSKKFPRELSGGMRMRASIARALITDPSVLLLDEPFAALDDLLRTRMNELVVELWTKRKRTIVFVTHNIAEAVYLSHRVAVFGQGRIARILDNQLAWPRDFSQRTSSEFAGFYGQISAALLEASV